MAQEGQIPWVGLVMVLLLFCLPALMVLLIGWPGSVSPEAAAARMGPIEPIAPPAPPIGLPPHLIRSILLLGGMALGFALGAWWFAPRIQRTLIQARSASRRLSLLIGAGAASLLIYALTLLWPFPLHRYYNFKQVSIGVIAERDRGVALGIAAAMIALFFLYGLAYRLCQGSRGRRLWIVLLAGVLLLALVNFFVATITTLDLYDYIARGRIAGVHGGNPYLHPPNDYPDDPFMAYASWGHETSAYGPLWETVSALLSYVAGDTLWANVLVYKGLILASYLLSVALIAAMLRRVAPERALAGTLLFAWNPLILLEGVANAHNDLLMVVLFLGGLWMLSRLAGRTGQAPPAPLGVKEMLVAEVALLLLAASVLVKFVSILLFPFVLLYLLARVQSWGRRIGKGLLLLLPVPALALLYYSFFWSGDWGTITDTFTRRGTMFRTSIAGVAKYTLQEHLAEETTNSLVSWVFLGLAILAYLGLLWRAARDLGWLPERWYGDAERQTWLARLERVLLGSSGAQTVPPWEAMLGAGYSALLFYLLLANFWFWPWYLLWPIALLALVGDKRTFLPLALASCAGQLSHLALNFVWYWWGISWETLYQVEAMTVLFMIVPALLLYAIRGLLRK